MICDRNPQELIRIIDIFPAGGEIVKNKVCKDDMINIFVKLLRKDSTIVTPQSLT